MTYDRKIIISVGNHRRSVNWQPQTLPLSEFYERLRVPARGTETMQQYLALKKSEQDDRKDVGGYIAGSLASTRRKAGAVTGRDLLTLDYDSIPPGGTGDILRRVEGLGCGYCVYSTRKHSPAAPRLRILLPLDRTVTADEYEPLARKIAETIGMEFADPTTFEVTRLMYWPSCCADSEYVYAWQDKPLLSADGVLAMYEDWRDVNSWPRHWGETSHVKLAMRQGDPLTKSGVVGAFCKTYDIYAAMEIFLPGIYEPVETMPGRYTYLGGSTAGGAVVYEDGRFLYSHHATDPCGGRLVNAFDLVRLHKFEGMDDEAKEGTPGSRLPSFIAMCELAVSDDRVASLMAQERLEEVSRDFAETDWFKTLSKNNQTGVFKSTIDNVWVILENDPNLKGKFALNEFAGRGEVLGSLPWEQSSRRRYWDDNDNQGLYWYLEKYYQITGNGKIDGALSLHSVKHSFNDVRDYLRALQWDGTPRLDTLLVNYLGAEDDLYTRIVTRKAFTAAVARAMDPGCKYDTMLILSGPQGIGKSTLLDKMSRGWFNDSIRTFEGKEASELLQGVWLVEISELDAFRRTDVARIKQFLSLRVDRFRAAYGRHVKELPRCCVFFGTTNTDEYLSDDTGNRRFLPVDVGISLPAKNIWQDLDGEIDQLWAEAVVRWRVGETVHLPDEIEQSARTRQEEHRERDAQEGIILDFIEQPVPEDWTGWTLDKRKMYWSGAMVNEVILVPRDRVCALEVWCEALNGQQKDMSYIAASKINAAIKRAKNWVKNKQTQRYGYCGIQRGFSRKRV